MAAAATAWLAAAVAVGAPGAAWRIALGLWLLAIVAIALAGRLPRGGHIAACVLAAALAVGVVALRAPMAAPADLARFDGGGVAVVGRVVSDARPAAGRPFDHEEGSRFVIAVEVQLLERGDDRREVRLLGDLYVDDGAGAGPGARVRAQGVLRVADPGERTRLRLFADGPAVVLDRAPAVLAWAVPLRAGLRDAATDLPGDGAALLPGLAVGDTALVDESLAEAMRASSLSHLTAVSGANCAIVTAAAFGLAALAGARRRVRIAAALGALAAFVVLVGPQPSVLRAAVMASIVLLALAAGRGTGGLPALALAVVVLLVADPWLARDAGFALSVLASAGLLALTVPLTDLLARAAPRGLAAVIAVPLAAQVACQPVLILLRPELPLLGVPTNLLAAPAAPVATVLGMIACFVLPVVPWLGEAVLRLAWLPAAWIGALARAAAEAPALAWPAGAGGVLLIVGMTAAGAVALLARRRAAVAVLVVLSGVAAGAVAGPVVGRSAGLPADWSVAACDVGQGDAVVLRDGGRTMLVDTGDEPELLTTCLDLLGVGRLDLLVLTHFDIDHVGAAGALTGRVDRVVTGPSDGADADRLLAELAAGGAAVERVRRGDAGVLGGAPWQVLWPPADREVEPGNDASVVLAVDGVLDVLLLGDLGAAAQRSLERAGPLPHADVVKMAHHGSADQDDTLYRDVGASAALVSAGADNDYGHPTAAALELLRTAGTTALRTDLTGTVVVAGDPSAPVVWTSGPRPAPD